MAKHYKQKYFNDMLEVMLNEAEICNQINVEIRAGDLHDRVVKEKGVSRAPMACSAMRKKAEEIMCDGQARGEIVYEPPCRDGQMQDTEFASEPDGKLKRDVGV